MIAGSSDNTQPVDPVELTARLIRCPSVTPDDAGALAMLKEMLEDAGFFCARIERGEVSNLFARFGPKGASRSFGFNGHTDVVPVGALADWSVDPFGGVERDGRLWGRGACDMKSGVAAFVAAAIDRVRAMPLPEESALIISITGDEEGPGQDGTRAILDWMADHDEAMTACLVGEPTCPDEMGSMMKIGRRGSMNVEIVARGVQGHVAYPHLARNPLHALVGLLDRLARHPLDEGTAHFDASTLMVTTIDTGNGASNMIPAQARAALNVRFNDAHGSAGLSHWLHAEADACGAETGIDFEISVRVSGESFITPPGALSDLVASAVQAETNRTPVLSTSGGTSDARFIKDHCPVVEFGLVGASMHQVDEHVEIAHVHQLKAIYRRVIDAWLDQPSRG